MLLDSVGGLVSCADALELLEEIPLELDDFPLWCEELYDEDVLLPFLLFVFELELLLRAFKGVLSRSSCFEELLLVDWCNFSDLLKSLELVALRDVVSLLE